MSIENSGDKNPDELYGIDHGIEGEINDLVGKERPETGNMNEIVEKMKREKEKRMAAPQYLQDVLAYIEITLQAQAIVVGNDPDKIKTYQEKQKRREEEFNRYLTEHGLEYPRTEQEIDNLYNLVNKEINETSQG